ncbi:MAG TPA: hypothetical protein VIH53_06810, partial [Gemmatimonadaceae bacterium]
MIRISSASVAAVVGLALGSGAASAQRIPAPAAVDSSGLSTLLAAAASVNAQVPERLKAYRTRIET